MRQVDDGRDTRLLRSLHEIYSGGYESRFDRVDKIGSVHALHGLSNRINLLKVADDDFCAELFQRFRSVVYAVDHGADHQSSF